MQVGNEFIISKPHMKVEVLAPEASLPPQSLLVAVHSHHADDGIEMPDVDLGHEATGTAGNHKAYHRKATHGTLSIIKRYRLATAALIILIIGSAAVVIGGQYWTSTRIVNHAAAAPIKTGTRPISGLNLTVPAADFQAKLQAITNQPATLTVGTNPVPVGSDTIRNWLQITSNKSKSEYYIHLNKAAIATSLTALANKYAKTPINQVTVNEDGVERVIVGGRNGAALSDLNTLSTQAQETAKTVMDGKGMQFNTPLATTPFQAVTPAAFDKLLVSNIATKKMWAYQNGQLVRSFLVSAGAPATPTPVGQYKVYAKFAVQDMRGNNADGSRYFQPKVPWVSYFTAGNAVHGVYWRPADWFGNINSSHGCVGVPVNDAKWVYDWAPIGTTVITHT
jgi:lipoprotein-anchoring transpeptidase ErfK/SrfK